MYQLTSKELDMPFKKCGIELDVFFVKEASENWNVSYENENNIKLKC